MRRLLVLPTDKPSLRLLADETAKMLAGMMHLLDGLALLVDAPGKLSAGHQGFQLRVPDWLPALVNAARAFITLGVVELFWVVTAWPNGASAMLFAAILVLLLSPKGDLAFGGSIAFAIGTGIAVICAALIKFAVLPGLDTFPAFCLALGLYFIPIGCGVALAHRPAVSAVFTAMAFNFMPLLSPTNQMNYNTVQFYNAALAIVAGCSVAPLAFRLLPLPSPEVRARRFLALTLRDMRRLAVASELPRLQDWEGLVYGRLAALPDQAEPLQRSRLLAALSVGTEIIHLRHIVPRLGAAADLDAALEDIARGNSAFAVARLRQLDRRLASGPDTGLESAIGVRARESHSDHVGGALSTCVLFRCGSERMSFAEINLFGVYVAPISLMMIGAWFVTIALRLLASRYGLLRYVWHPALFVFAVYIVVLSSWVLLVARRSS